ncbi:MAG: Hsp33 family molecular chaperone HslO [Monoglobales bacterium]
MKDIIIRGNENNGKIRFFAALTTELVNEAHNLHMTTPVVSAAFGRMLTAVSMMGTMLKGEDETISLQVRGDGPLEGIVAVGDCKGQVRGYVLNNSVDLPLKPDGKLDVGSAIGEGYLTVVRDLKLREPYVGRVKLQTGEIADDLTYYFASSEQVPSVVALGVLVDRDLSVRAAGGFILQLMPEAEETDIVKIEENLKDIPSVTKMLDQGLMPEDIMKKVLNGFDFKITETVHPAYKCNCSEDTIKRALISAGREELEDILAKEGSTEMTCFYCNKTYKISEKDIREILGK